MTEIFVKEIDGVAVSMNPSTGQFVAEINGKIVRRAAIVDIQRLIEKTATTKDKQVEALHITTGWDRHVRVSHVKLTSYRVAKGKLEYLTHHGDWIAGSQVYHLDPDAETYLDAQTARLVEIKESIHERIRQMKLVTANDFKNAGVPT